MASGAALLSAAVQAACQAKAPRRTVAAVAAAVTSVLLQLLTLAATQATVPERPLGPLETQEELELKLREVRQTKRRAKRQRRRAKAKAAANTHDVMEQDALEHPASTPRDALQLTQAASRMRMARAGIAEEPMTKDTPQQWLRPVPQVDPQVLEQLRLQRERSAQVGSKTSLTPVASGAQGAKDGKLKTDRGQQPPRRGPY